MSTRPECSHNAHLLVGRELCEDGNVLDPTLKLLIGELGHGGSVKRPLHVEANGLAHGARNAERVAGKDLGCHAMLTKSSYRLGGASLRRVEEGQVANERHALLVLAREHAHIGRVGLSCHAKNAHALVGQIVGRSQDLLAHVIAKGHHATAVLDLGANLKDLLDGPLGDRATTAVLVLNHHTHAPALEVKGDLIDKVPVRRKLIGIDAAPALGSLLTCAGNNRGVYEVAHARLEEAVEKGIAEHA